MTRDSELMTPLEKAAATNTNAAHSVVESCGAEPNNNNLNKMNPQNDIDPRADACGPPLLTRVGKYFLTKRVIGEGSNATVYEGFLPLASHLTEEEFDGEEAQAALALLQVKTKVAIKVVDKTQLSDEKKQDLLQEIKILRVVQGHPAIVQLHYVHETPQHFYLVFERKSMDLYSFIRKYRPIPEDKAKYIFSQLLSAFDHCHKLGVCHRDVKIENVLIDERTCKVALCDFGFASFFRRGQRLTKWCGSPHTVAPEIILRSPYDPAAADLWSLGSILYALLCGSFPFQARTYRDIFHRTTMGMYHGFPNFVSAAARDLIARMLRVDPEQRLAIAQLQSHPWLRQP